MKIPDFNRRITIDRDFRIRFRLSFTLFGLVVSLSGFYLLWEIYWARSVGYAVIKWHTHLAVYLYLWLLLYAPLYGLHRALAFRHYLRYRVIWASICCTLMLAEATLLALGIGDTYSEKLGRGYFSMYTSKLETYYRTYTPGEKLVMNRIDFKHIRSINSMGYADVEWHVKKMKNEKRILCLGDSWTEGIGAPCDSLPT